MNSHSAPSIYSKKQNMVTCIIMLPSSVSRKYTQPLSYIWLLCNISPSKFLPLCNTAWEGTSPSNLQQVYLPLMSQADCRATFPSLLITDYMMCAGTQGISTCQVSHASVILLLIYMEGPQYLFMCVYNDL